MSALDLVTLGARVKGVFGRTVEETTVEPWVDELSMATDSDQDEEKYVWLGRAARMTKWDTGPRIITSASQFSYTIANVDWANAIEISVKDWRRRKFGKIDNLVRDLAVMGVTHPNERMSEVIIDGETAACYDGQFFYDTDHEEGASGVQDNDITAAAAIPGDPTVEEMKKAIFKGIMQLRGFKDDKNKPMNQGMRIVIILIPTQLIPVAEAAVRSVITVAGGASATNELAVQTRYVLNIRDNPYLDTAWGGTPKKFSVLRADGGGAPFIFQKEVPMFLDSQGTASGEAFLNKRLLFGAQRSYEIGYGFWQQAVLVTFV